MTASLAGKRVMVVEDELLIAMMLEAALEDEHCVLIGPYARVTPALAAARTIEIDFALLDVNVAGEKIYPVAEQLEQRGIPFLLLSGYGQHAVPAGRNWHCCSKPFALSDLLERIEQGLIRLPKPRPHSESHPPALPAMPP